MLMVIQQQYSDSKSRRYTRLILIALFFAPYTRLRIGSIGFTELSMILLFLSVLINGSFLLFSGSLKIYIFTKFWFFYFIFICLGFIRNYFFFSFSSTTMTSVFFDTASYLVVFSSCFALESLFCISKIRIDIWRILKTTYFAASICLSILFFVGKFTGSSILMYYIFFRPFATNIHHVSMFIAPLPFVGLKALIVTKNMYERVFLLFLIFMNVIMGINTGSTKIFLSFIIGGIAFIFSSIFMTELLRKARVIVILSFLVIILGVTILLWNQIVSLSTNFFVENDMGGSRQLLYSSAIRKASDSPFIGYGPGSHAEPEIGSEVIFWDIHQTYLTVLIQGGLPSLVIYVLLIVAITKKCTKDSCLLGGLVSIIVYSLGGDILRRLPMWLFLVLFYYYCEQKEEASKKTNVKYP